MSYRLGSLGQYVLDRVLARGGMAEVFLAHRDGLLGSQDELVIKRIRRDRANDPKYVEMFLNEARIAEHFHHPNLVAVRELIQDRGQLAMVMEYVDGYSVRDLLQRCRQYARFVPLEIAAYIIAEAAEGLHYAHELRDEGGAHLHVVHRDVSPSNLIVTPEGGVRLLDFGVATSDSIEPDEPNAVRGKFSYLAPEAILNQPIDRRADVFGLGIVFYELLTLQPCFTHEDPVDTLDAIIHGRFQPVHDWRDSIPPELAAILERMLARRPADRFATAADVSILLWQYLVQTEPVMADDVQSFFAELFYDLPTIERSPHERDTVEIDARWLIDYAAAVDTGLVEEDTLIEVTDADLMTNHRSTGVDEVIAALDLPTSTPWSSEPLEEDNWSVVTPGRRLEVPDPAPIHDNETWWVNEGTSKDRRLTD